MKSTISVRLVSCLCAFLLAALFIPRLAARAQQSPSVRVSAHLVEVDVLVHDDHGQPITGLTQKDFSVTDDGQPMKITFFSTLTPVTPAAPGQQAASSQAAQGVFTNSPLTHPGVPANLTIILVDALNTPFGDMVYSTQQLMTYLSQLQPTDHVAVYTLGSKLSVLQDFTSDDSALVQAVKDYKPAAGSPADVPAIMKQVSASGASARLVSQIQNNLLNLTQAITPEMRNTSVSITLSALRQIAQHVAGIPGRKNLLWLSGGFPLDLSIKGMSTAGLSGADLGGESGVAGGMGVGSGASAFETMQPAVYLPQLEQTMRDLESANVAIYPVDARGLVAQTAAADPRFANTNTGGPTETSGDSQVTLDSIAGRTGGRAFFNTNAIAGSLSAAQGDAQYSYLIGYTPNIQWDGKFHKVDIKVNQAGAHVRAREGYFAMAPPSAANAADDRKLALGTAANAVLDSTAVPFAIEIHAVSGGKSSDFNALLSIAGSAIQFVPDGTNYDAQLEMVIVQRDAAGNPIASSGSKMSWAIPANEYQAAQDGILTNNAKFTLAASADTVRFIVRDGNSRELGSVTVPVIQFPAAPSK